MSYIGSNPNSVPTIGAICGKNLIYSESVSGATFKMEEAGPHQAAAGSHQLNANPHQAESKGFNIVIRVGASNGEEIEREVCTQLILEKASLEGRAVFPMQRTIETCNVKSTS